MFDPDDTLEGVGPRGLSLDSLTEHSDALEGIRKNALDWGDRVVVVTRNSVYTLSVLGDEVFSVSGGWFERKGMGGSRIRVNGCTWGGRAIHEELVAAPGLFLEFGNGVTTTRIQKVVHWRHREQEVPD